MLFTKKYKLELESLKSDTNMTLQAIQAQGATIDDHGMKIDSVGKLLITTEEKLNERIEVLEKHLEEYLETKKRKESDEPFIQVLSQDFNVENGIELKLDWNDAMINYLKRNGYVGVDQDDIIERYIADLFRSKAGQGIPA